MRLSTKSLLGMLLFSALMVLIILIMQPLEILHFGDLIDVLFPTGIIAREERNLLLIVQGLMLLVIIPVYILTFLFSWIYRADNKKAKYDPKLVDNSYAEIIWWGLPLVMTAIVCVLTAIKTYELDPYKPIPSNKKEITIQVVALQWRWLFIYPEERIATINFFQIPKNTPIRFEISADAPMNSFWIPDFGGQIYAMPGMTSYLNLMANEEGDSRGLSANISGKGFSKMTFLARVSSEENYRKWLEEAKRSGQTLDYTSYKKLADPSENRQVETFRLEDKDLFEQIVNRYMFHP